MLLAVDIGNSFTKFGVFDEDEIVLRARVRTTEIGSAAGDADLSELKGMQIDEAIACSVVPVAENPLMESIGRLGCPAPTFVTARSNFGIFIRYASVDTLGLDRLVNASAAAAIYGSPVIVCSFGTATTIDLVNADAEFVGGTISPGTRLMAESLHSGTSQLPVVNIQRPKSVTRRFDHFKHYVRCVLRKHRYDRELDRQNIRQNSAQRIYCRRDRRCRGHDRRRHSINRSLCRRPYTAWPKANSQARSGQMSDDHEHLKWDPEPRWPAFIAILAVAVLDTALSGSSHTWASMAFHRYRSFTGHTYIDLALEKP